MLALCLALPAIYGTGLLLFMMVPALAIKDRAASPIKDRSGNYILSRQ